MGDIQLETDSEDDCRANKKKLKICSSDEENDNIDEESHRKEMKEFLNDTESESEDEDGNRSMKKQCEETSVEDLDEEDLDLIEENLGVKLQKRRKRIRLASSDEDVKDNREDCSASDEDLPDTTGRPRPLSSGGSDEEEISNFIVDIEGRPVGQEKSKKHLFEDSQRQLAEDIFGVAIDYEELEEEEDELESGLDSSDEEERPHKEKKKGRVKTIFDIISPDELCRGHYTDHDEEIRNTDIPERMQVRQVPVEALAENYSEELDREAEWIYRKGFMEPTLTQQTGFTMVDCQQWKHKTGTKDKIRKALQFMRQEFFEIPFIAFYRKEYVSPELDIHHLWRVYLMDEKWTQLQRRKRKLRLLMEKMQIYHSETLTVKTEDPFPEGMKMIRQEDIDCLEIVESVEELKDIYDHFLLYHGRQLGPCQDFMKKKAKEDENNKYNYDVEPKDPQADHLKHASKSNAYSSCVKFKISGMVARFGLSPKQFGENLRNGFLRNVPQQDPIDVADAATEYLGAKFKTIEEVVKAAVFMMATEISKEPSVRQTVREIFQEKAKISVRPTLKGMKEIGEDHEIFTMKYLWEKPIKEFKNEQFLKLQAASDDGLVTLTVAEDVEGNSTGSDLLTEAQDLYRVDESSKNVTNWNKLRADAVEKALKDMMFPTLRKELIHKVRCEAINGIKRKIQKTVYDWIKWAPYTRDFPAANGCNGDDWKTSNGSRVMGIAYNTEENRRSGTMEATFAVVISSDGEVVDFVKLPWFMKRTTSTVAIESQGKAKDMAILKKFIKEKRPHVITIAADDMDARTVIRDVVEILTELKEQDEFPDVLEAHLLDNQVAKVYSNTNKAKNDFPEYPATLLQAISVARMLQDPLIELSQLCGSENEILCIRFHPMQDLIGDENLIEAINMEFINRVTEVGVDINECLALPHRSNLLQFVAGLGPRKAASLLKNLRSLPHQRLENRQQLVTCCHMGPNVFINCAGFIKIDTSWLGDSEVYVELLDGSRIHNEAYEWARKMAVDALELDYDDNVDSAAALEDVLRQPEKLDELNLDAFADEIERQGFGNKSITLYDIRDELNSMYKDKRMEWQPPTEEEVFNILTKETPDTFYQGKLCLVSVDRCLYKKPEKEELDKAAPVKKGDGEHWQCPFCGQDHFPELTEVWKHFDAVDEDVACRGKCYGVAVRFDNGVFGTIQLKDFSDGHVLNPEERIQKGQRIYVRILRVIPERFKCDCISKSSALKDVDWEFRPERDKYYDEVAEKEDLEKGVEKMKAQQDSTFNRRIITHSAFRNVSFKEAESLLQEMDQGDAIIRPSSKGVDRLTVTWKVTDDVYQHIDIIEEGKTDPFSLGSSLWIGSEEFEDLDEIIARHIAPMASFCEDILSFKYYRSHTKGDERSLCERMIVEEKRANPRMNYIITASKEFSGKFMITYISRGKVRHEFVTVLPDGLRFRKQNFESLNLLIKCFKEHMKDRTDLSSAIGSSRLEQTGTTDLGRTSQCLYRQNQL